MHSNTRGYTFARQSHSAFRQRFIAILSALALVLGLSALTLNPVQAATPGIQIDLLHNGSIVADNTVIPEGDELTLRVQYDAMKDIDGKEITITLPSVIELNGALPTNNAIETIVDNGDGTITVRFKDPIPADIAEGAFALKLRTVEVEQNTEVPITWQIGDDKDGVTIIIENEVVPPVEVKDGYSKSVNPTNLNSYVIRSASPEYAFVGLNPTIADAELTYTLVLSSDAARNGFTITDALPAGLGYVSGSFASQLTTESGTVPFTFAPAIAANTFTGTVDVPAQSTLTITYKAKVTNVASLEAALRVKYEDRNNTPGNYSIILTNTATFGGPNNTATANVTIRGTIPGPGVGTNFAKTGNWTLRDVIADADGKLQPPTAMTYTLKADLTPWDERNSNFTLTRNVVIQDTLIDQASWVTGADFITVSGAGPITTLTKATDCTTAADFAADAYVGQYCVTGKTLLINVGKDKTTNLSIQVKAQLDNVNGLTGTPSETMVGGMNYPWTNRASFIYSASGTANRDHDATVVVVPEDREGGINDSAAFSKTAAEKEIQVNPGESAEVPYRFRVDTSKENIDPLKARIIDEVDTDIFDISDLGAVGISGSYDGLALTRDHFALSTDADGRLVIELSAAGKTVVEGQAKGKIWIVDLVLTTIPFDGKETFEIYNKATLESDGSEWFYWSESYTEATSFGDEAELRKRLFNPETGEWVSELDALIEDGEFVNNRFVYSIELIPRGNYGASFPVQVYTREDHLPEAVDFHGFVTLDADGTPEMGTASGGPIDMNGNVEATYADGVVTIQQKAGTSLDRNNGRIIVYFAVDANNADAEILNEIIGSEAIIKPVGDPSIDIEKWSEEGDEEPEYDESGALLNDGFAGDFDTAPGKELEAGEMTLIRFTVSNDGREDLVNVTVSDQLTDGSGEIEQLVCIFPDESVGTTWSGPFKVGTQFDCAGLLPALEAGDTHSDLAKVTGVGILSGIEVNDEDAWHGFVEAEDLGSEDLGTDDEDKDAAGIIRTGGTPLWILGLAVALLAGGATLLAARRRSEVTAGE